MKSNLTFAIIKPDAVKNKYIGLIINHIVVLHNVFGVEVCCTLLLFKIEREFWVILKTFLFYLNYIKDEELKSVKINKTILKSLQEL